MKYIKNYIPYLWVVIITTIYSPESPLYTKIPSSDTGTYSILGTHVLNGHIPLIDAFEQKGPVWWYICGLARLMFSHNVYGFFILQLIIFMIEVKIIIKIFKSLNIKYYKHASIITITFIETVKSHDFPSVHISTDTMTGILTLLTIYFFLNYYKFNDKQKHIYVYIIGLLSSIIFWSKFTCVAGLIGAMLIYIIYLIKKHKILELIKSFIYYIFGFLTLTIPLFVFYAIHGSLFQMLKVYFIDIPKSYNQVYSYGHNDTFVAHFIQFFSNLYSVFRIDSILVIIFVVSIACILLQKTFSKLFKYTFLLSFIFMVILTTYTHNLSYYLQDFTPYIAFGFVIFIINIYEHYFIGSKKILVDTVTISIIFILFLCNLTFAKSSPKVLFDSANKDILNVTNIINGYSKKPSIIYASFISTASLGVRSNAVPTAYYFLKVNASYRYYPILENSIMNDISEKKSDFVVWDAGTYLYNIKDTYIYEHKHEFKPQIIFNSSEEENVTYNFPNQLTENYTPVYCFDDHARTFVLWKKNNSILQ